MHQNALESGQIFTSGLVFEHVFDIEWSMQLGTLTSKVAAVRDQLSEAAIAPGAAGSSAELIDLIAALEDLKTVACGVQAEATVTFDARRRSEQAAAGVSGRLQGRGVANEIALARKESPHRGQVLLGMAKILVSEMPHALARMRDGSLSEFRATILARETACLQVEDRLSVDRELCADPRALDGVGTRELAGRVRRMVAELDPGAVARRARKAESERGVTVRPAPDTMGYLTALVPVAQAVAVYAALLEEADRLRAAGDPRSKSQVMADLLVTRCTGVPDTGTEDHAPAVPVCVNITMPDTALAGGHAPAEVSAGGVAPDVIPAEIARLLAARAMDAGLGNWFRGLYRNQFGKLVAMTSRQRRFPEGLAQFLAFQGGGICATPWCDAPIRHSDHIQPVDEGGETSADNGQGLCEACNHAKQAPRWQQNPIQRGQGRPRIETTTPTGHRYRTPKTAPPGWITYNIPMSRFTLTT